MRNHAIVIVLSLLILPAARGALAYDVKAVGSFHIGGEQVVLSGLPDRELRFTANSPPMRVNPNGEFEVGQMYVQYVTLASPKTRYPLLMWHGGGLTGVTWETKPDGGEGWQDWFLKAGYSVYVSDAVERGRASWARYPEIYSVEPFFRPKSEAWELFRMGPSGSYSPDPAKRRPYPGVAFPIDSFDQFAKQIVPRWTINDDRAQKAYDALVQRVCPCVIMAHSTGGPFAFTAALHAPDKVKAIVAVNRRACKRICGDRRRVEGARARQSEGWYHEAIALRAWHQPDVPGPRRPLRLRCAPRPCDEAARQGEGRGRGPDRPALRTGEAAPSPLLLTSRVERGNP